MRITIKLFAAVRDAVEQDEVVIEVPQGATVAQVRAAFCEAFPRARVFVERSLFAIDMSYAQDNEVMRENAEVACIPPVSGG
jgi:molybdopterin converting factor subunit 1